MSKLYHFLRLLRFGNLVIIALSMCVVQSFIASHGNSNLSLSHLLYLLESTNISSQERWLLTYNLDFNFCLLMLSVLFIAGAGNIINDYFDITTDKINKPKRLIVGQHISTKNAFFLSWTFNIIGASLAAYLSYLSSNWFIALVALITITFLWFYSAVYKKKLIVGNILVALMIGIVPLYVLIYNLPFQGYSSSVNPNSGNWFIYEVIFTISIIAFVINLIREIIKDIADIKGDLQLAAKTVPIALGIRSAKYIIIGITIPLVSLMAFYIFNMHYYNSIVFDQQKIQNQFHLALFTILIILSIIICLTSLLLILTANRRKRYLIASNLLKIAMLFGMLSPLLL